MIKSKDGLIEIYQGDTPADVIYQPASWSVINVPSDKNEASALEDIIYDSATTRHVMLALCRHKRKDRIAAVKNLPSKNWNYLETISIIYEKPSTCSNNGFLPLAETGWIFFKGDTPDTKKTNWFSGGDYNNATNLWNVAPQVIDEADFIYYQKFNAETQLLLMNLSSPAEHKRFIYTLPLDKKEQVSFFNFCNQYKMVGALYTKTHQEAEEIIFNYNRFLENK